MLGALTMSLRRKFATTAVSKIADRRVMRPVRYPLSFTVAEYIFMIMDTRN